MKKVLLVLIACLTAIVAIQFASTASSAPKKQAVSPLVRRVAKLEKTVKTLTRAVNGLNGFAGCLISQNAPPFGVTRTAFTTPTGGYLDITPQGGTPTFISLQVDPQCLSGSSTKHFKPQFRLAH